jgi:hypothetical protein
VIKSTSIASYGAFNICSSSNRASNDKGKLLNKKTLNSQEDTHNGIYDPFHMVQILALDSEQIRVVAEVSSSFSKKLEIESPNKTFTIIVSQFRPNKAVQLSFRAQIMV